MKFSRLVADKFKGLGKAGVLGAGVGALAVTGMVHDAQAALDVTGVQTALDTNIATYETVAVAIIGFVLAVAVIYGVISLIKGRAK